MFTMVLIFKDEGRIVGIRGRLKDATLLALKVEKGPHSKRNWVRRGNRFSPGASRRILAL